MASKHLPWHWSLETLAGSKETDTSVLRAVASKIRDLETSASEIVRERVSLKYLEELLYSTLFDPDQPSTSESVREIHGVQTNEEKVVTLHNLDRDRSELCSHDLRQFVLHKRANVPKSSLDMLKEAILEGCCHDASSLKECSGLSTHILEDNIHCNNGDDEVQPTSPTCHNVAINLHNGRSETGKDHECLGLESLVSDQHDVRKLKNQKEVIDVPDDDTEREAPSSRNNERHVETKRQDAASGRTHQPQGTVENQNKKKSPCSKSRKHKSSRKRYSNPLTPYNRRKRLKWTTKEEEYLKVTMQKVVLNDSGSIPWTNILDSGCHVFHKTRQPLDLKDKWCNIEKKARKSSKHSEQQKE